MLSGCQKPNFRVASKLCQSVWSEKTTRHSGLRVSFFEVMGLAELQLLNAVLNLSTSTRYNLSKNNILMLSFIRKIFVSKT